MPGDNLPKADDCNCFAVRSAARHVSQLYDQFLVPIGLRTTQFSILAKLKRRGPLTINALADEMVMDRTTLGRNILPLARDGLIQVEPVPTDRRAKALLFDPRGRQALAGRRQSVGERAVAVRSHVRGQARERAPRHAARGRRQRVHSETPSGRTLRRLPGSLKVAQQK